LPRVGITFDRVGLRKETPVSYLALEPDSGQKKKTPTIFVRVFVTRNTSRNQHWFQLNKKNKTNRNRVEVSTNLDKCSKKEADMLICITINQMYKRY
jgi:hypothetical protein